MVASEMDSRSATTVSCHFQSAPLEPVYSYFANACNHHLIESDCADGDKMATTANLLPSTYREIAKR